MLDVPTHTKAGCELFQLSSPGPYPQSPDPVPCSLGAESPASRQHPPPLLTAPSGGTGGTADALHVSRANDREVLPGREVMEDWRPQRA